MLGSDFLNADIKIIATDLDGTLMAPDHMTVTERTKNALKKAQEKGVKIAVSTGRTLAFISDVTKKVPFLDYIIFSNGAGVYDCKAKKIIYNEGLTNKQLTNAVRLLDGLGVTYQVYAGGKAYIKTMDLEEYTPYEQIPESFRKFLEQNTIMSDDIIKEIGGDTAELCAIYFIGDDARREILKFISGEENLTYVTSFMDNIEIISKNAGKANALDAICRINGCTAENAMAFGDSTNDCSMLEYAEYSFAMANGNDECKKSAKFSALSNAEDGVARAVEQYVLNM